MIITSDDVLEFWFEKVNDRTVIRKKQMPFKKWFYGGRVFDENVRLKFGALLEEALSGSLKNWEDALHGTLALIIILDQLSRNVFRNTVRMYDGDKEALRLSFQLIESGKDKDLQYVERLFVYMPLMHAENVLMQKMSVGKFKELAEGIFAVNGANDKYYRDQLGYAEKYRSIIERFGRFPHRNNMLKRISSAQEEEFLKMSQTV